jgi:hypothetical protein
MKRIIIIILSLSLVYGVSAQNHNNKLLETPLSFHRYKDYWKFMRSQHSLVWGGVALNTTRFPNMYLLGFKPQIKVAYFPFIFEAGNINDILTLSKITYPPNSNNNPVQRGGDFSCYDFTLSVCPLPYFCRWSEIVVPHIGFGYQISSVELFKNENEILSLPSRLNLSGWMYRFGINLFFDNFPVNISIEYERSLRNPNKLRGYQSLSVGILVDVKRKLKQKDKLYLLY